MRYRTFASAGAVALTLALIGSGVVAIRGQAPSAPKIPRTLDGKPDFSGIWTGILGVPVDRPAGAPEFISREELLKQKQTDQKQRVEQKVYGTASVNESVPSQIYSNKAVKVPDSYNTLWRDGYWEKWDQIITLPQYRTNQVIDPPDGKLPALTPRAEELGRLRRARSFRPSEGPEDMPIYSGRCVRGIASGPPYRAPLNGHYNHYWHIVQAPATFAVIQEMIHETQLVPLDGSAHPPETVRLLKGDSRGHWEGDTLVIDSRNFVGATELSSGPMTVGNAGGAGTSSEKLHVVERYKMIDGNNIQYSSTVEDPDTTVRPYTIEWVWYRLPDQKQLSEYACHEGNRALEYILSGARALEAKGIKDPAYFGEDGKATKKATDKATDKATLE